MEMSNNLGKGTSTTGNPGHISAVVNGAGQQSRQAGRREEGKRKRCRGEAQLQSKIEQIQLEITALHRY